MRIQGHPRLMVLYCFLLRFFFYKRERASDTINALRFALGRSSHFSFAAKEISLKSDLVKLQLRDLETQTPRSAFLILRWQPANKG